MLTEYFQTGGVLEWYGAYLGGKLSAGWRLKVLKAPGRDDSHKWLCQWLMRGEKRFHKHQYARLFHGFAAKHLHRTQDISEQPFRPGGKPVDCSRLAGRLCPRVSSVQFREAVKQQQLSIFLSMLILFIAD